MANSRLALWESGHDESVEVNQRALIDKVLARYSGEFTVFRELLQNSDDAQSSVVQIHFETDTYLKSNANDTEEGSVSEGKSIPDLRTAQVKQWTFKNNGIVFREEDWSRLKKIAEGNPDEEKIGAFGVGFYSLFSVTEEPFVKSGDQWMAFYWKDKKDQLFARRGHIPNPADQNSTTWTSFEMPLRETSPIPTPFDFTRFLASSITFMTHIQEIKVFFDDKCLACLTKTSGVAKSLSIPKNLNSSSQLGIMTATGINRTSIQIQASIMQCVFMSGTDVPHTRTISKAAKPTENTGFFSSLFSSFSAVATPQPVVTQVSKVVNEASDPMKTRELGITLSIFSANINVRLDKKISTELYRSTKKTPPSKMKYELIYTAEDQYKKSQDEDARLPFKTGSIFQGLRADLEGAGLTRIFIGHATAQTTGIGGHMAARFIPTVERESIDFMDRNVAIWNKELLYIGGLLARCAYEFELQDIRDSWVNNSLEKQAAYYSRFVHILKFFTFHQSTPSSEVCSLLESAFFSCSNKEQFSVLSTKGVHKCFDVRLPDPTFSGFLKELPVLPLEIMDSAQLMVASFQSRELIKAITFEDILKELRSRPLNDGEMVACLKWWTGISKQGDESRLLSIRAELLNAAVLVIGSPGHADESIIPLTSIKSFINPRSTGGLLPLDGPLPTHLLPVCVSKHIPPESLSSSFPWTELSVVSWLQHICDVRDSSIDVQFDINKSSTWAERVFSVLMRSWPTLSAPSKNEIVTLLRKHSCIPTSNGMKIPTEAYFVNANIFHDLPVVTFPSGTSIKGNLERLLEALGVRKHVDLQVIFNRMIKTNEWTIADLTKYLVSVKATLNAEEMARLRVTAAFPIESTTNNSGSALKRCHAKELYEPLDVFRELGLPVIDWGTRTKWRGSSEEAKFLFDVGLQRFPPLTVLIELCASGDSNVREAALKYLIENLGTRYPNYDPSLFDSISFIPALKASQPCLGTPKEVFSYGPWAALGFLVIHPSIQHNASKLKVREHPTSAQLISLLESRPPKDAIEGQIWFNILSGRVHDFSPTDLNRLSTTPFVPLETQLKVTWLPPSQCYLGGNLNDKFHSKLFVFIDFGTAGNAFLTACGTRQEPSVEEVAIILLADPHKFYKLAQGPTQFLAELRNIAVNFRQITTRTLHIMKRSPILLGSQRQRRQVEKKANPLIDDFDEDEWDSFYDLRKPDQIVIADDTLAYQAFGDSLFSAPQEDILEAFYVELGSRRLSALVKEEYQTSQELQMSKTTSETRALILERLPLFLHEHSHSRTKVSYSWLNSGNNFVVKSFGKLSVTKSLSFGELRLSRKQDASAVAKRFGSGSIQLWLAGNAQIDMYEVATSLNRLLFDSPKANDALLFMTILSTDLRALKRRGYNVERILKRQSAERQAAESLRAAESNTTLISQPPSVPVLEQERELSDEISKKPTPVESVKNSFQNLRRKIGVSNTTQENAAVNQQRLSTLVPHNTVTRSPLPGPKLSGGQSVTPLSNISSNIDMAIRACRPESGNLLRNREEMQQVKESLNEGYCDISGRTGNLNIVGEIENVKVFLSQDIPKIQAQDFMNTKHDCLTRFVHIMESLAKTYQLPSANLHIFFDLDGGLIAFNRSGSIFLNLRYYEAWHDNDVHAGNLDSAYVSWYFTMAHEIAHNLVQPHNSEHEFYFSAICEKHIKQLGALLSESKN